MNKNSFNSDIWWPDIEKFACLFMDFINNKVLKVDDKQKFLNMKSLELVKEAYFKNLYVFKKRFYGKDASKKRLDRHKIAALYIKSFLEISPFYLDIRKPDKNLLKVLKFPNEYFSVELMKLILLGWNKTDNKIFTDKNEKKWFLVLINHFRLDLDTLDILSLAQIIYYIEKNYLAN